MENRSKVLSCLVQCTTSQLAPSAVIRKRPDCQRCRPCHGRCRVAARAPSTKAGSPPPPRRVLLASVTTLLSSTVLPRHPARVG